MPYYLLLCRSITHAQRMSAVLEKAGIYTRMLRPPLGLTDRGCSYALQVSEAKIDSALERLRLTGLKPIQAFYFGRNGAHREIPLP